MKLKNRIKITMILTMLLFTFSAFSQTAIKRVVVEESTGVWCASCAYGSVYFEHLENNYPNAIPIAVHTGPGGQDSMAIFSVELYMIDYFNGSPTFLMDRKDFPENPSNKPAISASNTWEHGIDTLDYYMNQIYNVAPLATVGIAQSYDASTRTITATITGNFIADATGNFRLNCFILEDSVTGGPHYDQANSNFSGWAAGPAYLQTLIDSPHPIPNYAHNHVLRAALGNPEGVTASIPTTVTSGSSYSKIFTYVLPAEFDETKISLVGLVQNYGADKVADREIVNANSQHLVVGPLSISELEKDFIEFSIYPNPVEDNTSIEFYAKNNETISCSLYNMKGEMVKEVFNQYFVSGEYRVDLGVQNLESGVYILRFSNNKYVVNKRVVVNK